MNKLATIAALAAVTVLAVGVTHAQPYPNKPVRIVVPYTPGGPADVLVRGLGQKLSEKWGQQIVVENKPGANEIVAAEAVAKSAPDGYTFLLASDAVFTLNSSLYSKLPYDAVKDFVPVSKLVTANLMLVARPDFPANSVKELAEYARANPGKISYGSVGAGGVNHLPMAWFANQNNLKMEHVPYKGLVQALQDMIAGRLDVMYAVIGGALPFVQSNKVKGIAQSGSARSTIIPNVPTFAEAGFPAFDASFYFALAAPTGTPRDIVARLATDASEIVRSAEFREKYLTNLGFEPVGDTPEQFAAFLVNDRKLGAEKVKVSGAKLD
jgi:tripartite-type tricarboxylate transporter receptor subunit TctC